jgi:hypothetical protein
VLVPLNADRLPQGEPIAPPSVSRVMCVVAHVRLPPRPMITSEGNSAMDVSGGGRGNPVSCRLSLTREGLTALWRALHLA